MATMTFQKILLLFRQTMPVSSLITYTNWFLVGSLIWLSGAMTAKVIEKNYLNTSKGSSAYLKPRQNITSKPLKLKAFDVIITNNVFDAEVTSKAAPDITEAPIVEVPASEVLKKVLGNLQLMGIYRGQRYYSIIRYKKTNKEDLFGINDEIFDTGAVVAKIISWNTRKEVHIRLNNEVGILEYVKDALKDTKAAKTRAPVRRKAAPRQTPKRNTASNSSTASYSKGDNQFYLRSDEVEKHIADFPKLLNQAKVVPYIVDGKSEGYTIKYIDKGSLYEQLGLKNHDIIQKVNGKAIDSMEKAILLFNTLKNEREITINIMRNNQPMSLNYHIN